MNFDGAYDLSKLANKNKIKEEKIPEENYVEPTPYEMNQLRSIMAANTLPTTSSSLISTHLMMRL